MTSSTSTPMTSITLTGLTGNTEYTVTVEASTGAGRGPGIDATRSLPSGPCESLHFDLLVYNMIIYDV